MSQGVLLVPYRVHCGELCSQIQPDYKLGNLYHQHYNSLVLGICFCLALVLPEKFNITFIYIRTCMIYIQMCIHVSVICMQMCLHSLVFILKSHQRVPTSIGHPKEVSSNIMINNVLIAINSSSTNQSFGVIQLWHVQEWPKNCSTLEIPRIPRQ